MNKLQLHFKCIHTLLYNLSLRFSVCNNPRPNQISLKQKMIKCHRVDSKHDFQLLFDDVFVPHPMQEARQGHVAVKIDFSKSSMALNHNDNHLKNNLNFNHILIFGGRSKSKKNERRTYLNDIAICNLKSAKWTNIQVINWLETYFLNFNIYLLLL
jgi:hypothetical protein